MQPAIAATFPPFWAMAALFGKGRTAGGGPGSPGDPSAQGGSASGYDRVGLGGGAGGETRWMTKAEFQALPLTERVRHLAGGEVRFYRGSLEISPMEAMRGMP